MKQAQLHHNPGAGDEVLSEAALCAILREEGFECRQFATENDFIIVAGGDGTVRKTVKELLERDPTASFPPLALLPMGTANNIGRALSIEGSMKEIIRSWHHRHIRRFDTGEIKGLSGFFFFLEGLGCGVFPQLIKNMEPIDDKIEDLETAVKLKTALAELHRVIPKFEAVEASMLIDGVSYKGRYLMIEILNIRSVGPNLVLAPHADPGDGILEVVLVPEEDRFKLALYVEEQLKDRPSNFPFPVIQCREIKLETSPTLLHIDDQLTMATQKTNIEVSLQPGRFSFLI